MMFNFHKLTRRARRVCVAVIAALGLLAIPVLSSDAQADVWGHSTTHGDFSALVTANPSNGGYVDDCLVEIGAVFDSFQPGWHKIGGVRVNCWTTHAVIRATVWLQYYDFGAQVPRNTSRSTVASRYGQKGTGYLASSILRTEPVCDPVRGRSFYWRTVALVQTENIGGYTYSMWQQAPASC